MPPGTSIGASLRQCRAKAKHQLPLVLPRYLYASPRYLALSDEPKEPGEMAQHECPCMPKVAAWMLDRGTKKVEVAVAAASGSTARA
jgi:hypothetical protein